jgi:opacity protein-like surface antigen
VDRHHLSAGRHFAALRIGRSFWSRLNSGLPHSDLDPRKASPGKDRATGAAALIEKIDDSRQNGHVPCTTYVRKPIQAPTNWASITTDTEVAMRNPIRFCRPRGSSPIRNKLLITLVTLAAVVFIMGAPSAWAADEPEEKNEPAAHGTAQAPPDFRFTPVGGWFGIRGGYSLTRADSDIWEFYFDNLTLEESDFNQGLFGVDVGWVINPRVEMIFGFEYLTKTANSEDRYYVDEFGAPINQQTQFRQWPLYVKLRVNLIPRGKQIGSYSWVPSKVVPYAGGGIGMTGWEIYQYGDFVDYTDLTIFYEEFLARGWAFSYGLFGGADISITPSVGVMAQLDYNWAEDNLPPAFAGFDPVDLSGLRISFGVNFRF